MTIWIEAEQWSPGQWNPQDCNSDVIVSFDLKGRWIATFFTYENIQTLAKKNRESGECMKGRYFYATDMILVEELTRTRVEEVIECMIAEEEFQAAFRFIPESAE